MSPQLTTFEQLEARVVELERLSAEEAARPKPSPIDPGFTLASLILAKFIKECAANPMDKLKATHALLAIETVLREAGARAEKKETP